MLKSHTFQFKLSFDSHNLKEAYNGDKRRSSVFVQWPGEVVDSKDIVVLTTIPSSLPFSFGSISPEGLVVGTIPALEEMEGGPEQGIDLAPLQSAFQLLLQNKGRSFH